jgi:hypothetical protein
MSQKELIINNGNLADHPFHKQIFHIFSETIENSFENYLFQINCEISKNNIKDLK